MSAKFNFSSTPANQDQSKFTGRMFFEIYKDADFLRVNENVETILSKGYELRQNLKKVAPGETIVMEKMMLERNTPLLVKNTFGANVPVQDFEFSYNRLMGLTAAYALENRHRFPVIKSSEATALGLTWNNADESACRLYLAAVSGTEHFPQFSYYPLLCALKKLQLKKITVPPVVKIAKIKNDAGERMAIVLMKNMITVYELWTNFGGKSEVADLKDLFANAPPELKKVFLAKV